MSTRRNSTFPGPKGVPCPVKFFRRRLVADTSEADHVQVIGFHLMGSAVACYPRHFGYRFETVFSILGQVALPTNRSMSLLACQAVLNSNWQPISCPPTSAFAVTNQTQRGSSHSMNRIVLDGFSHEAIGPAIRWR